MSTLAEIENALVQLSPGELRQVEEILARIQRQSHEEREIAALARRNGFNPFPRRSGELVTTEFVRQLCEEEGI